MRDAMIHRGPDDAGSGDRRTRRVVLGHRRLSIVDLSAARATSRCRTRTARVWITFNGEIYNHARLRARPGGRGPHVPLAHRHRSDRAPVRGARPTTVVRPRSTACSRSGIWDAARAAACCSRAIGWARSRSTTPSIGGRLLFASEIKGAARAPRRRAATSIRMALEPLPDVRQRARRRTRCSPASRSCPPATACCATGSATSRRALLVGGSRRPVADRDVPEDEAVAHVARAAVRAAVQEAPDEPTCRSARFCRAASTRARTSR